MTFLGFSRMSRRSKNDAVDVSHSALLVALLALCFHIAIEKKSKFKLKIFLIKNAESTTPLEHVRVLQRIIWQ